MVEISQKFVAFSEYMNFNHYKVLQSVVNDIFAQSLKQAYNEVTCH